MKYSEPIPFMGIVEIDESEDRNLFHSKTQQDVADELGVSRNTISVTEKRAVKKFKEVFLSKYNKDDFI